MVAGPQRHPGDNGWKFLSSSNDRGGHIKNALVAGKERNLQEAWRCREIRGLGKHGHDMEKDLGPEGLVDVPHLDDKTRTVETGYETSRMWLCIALKNS